MSSFNNTGGEDDGDICNNFNFDEDDDAVVWMQSEWDEDTSTTAKKRKFNMLKAIACCPRKDCSYLSMLHDPDMCSALVRTPPPPVRRHYQIAASGRDP